LVLKYVTLDELKQNLENPEKLRALQKKRAESVFITAVEEYEFKIFEGLKAERMAQEMLPKVEKTSFVKGLVGCVGANPVVRGTARVLLSPSEIARVNAGDVLVTQMTTPEFVPAMRKALAVVTDEGGVTCHAAIVSRELGIPCVIGTKTATKIFKDGDLVEVNASTGMVRKI
jgi:pyruvate,water dikinase